MDQFVATMSRLVASTDRFVAAMSRFVSSMDRLVVSMDRIVASMDRFMVSMKRFVEVLVSLGVCVVLWYLCYHLKFPLVVSWTLAGGVHVRPLMKVSHNSRRLRLVRDVRSPFSSNCVLFSGSFIFIF